MAFNNNIKSLIYNRQTHEQLQSVLFNHSGPNNTKRERNITYL